MSGIAIVTAFFDIGRGDWTANRGLPSYLQRTTDTYFERFAHMARLENEMVVYTSEDLADRVRGIREDKRHRTTVITVDFLNDFQERRDAIRKIQSDPSYIAKINPRQVRNPEYWSADYVLVNLLNSSFVNRAVGSGLIESEMVAWLDFGYCREAATLNGVSLWQYPFDECKIHCFQLKQVDPRLRIENVVANNDVHIIGSSVIASKRMWPELGRLVDESFRELVELQLVDDDQTLLLMAALKEPDKFVFHRIAPDDWFVVFRRFQHPPAGSEVRLPC